MLENTDIDSNPSSRENLSNVSPEDVEAEFEKEWKNADVEQGGFSIFEELDDKNL